jgi:threonylcarbamoyladenosine tRNA methylthiotransferase MtaB
MRTFSISTLGCKVNQYEGQAIREFLEGLGLSAVEPSERPEIVVINTCCVTATASAKSRQYIQRAGKLSPDAIRVVCGCLPAMKSREMTLSGGNNIRIVSSRDDLPGVLTQIVIGENTCIRAENGVEIKDRGAGFAKFPRLPLLTSFKGHTRAFLKVQDGCDGQCTYCIVPKVRPDVHSKPIDEAIEEAKALVAAGHKEIVVTGVNLGAYGRSTTKKLRIADCRLSIVDLLTALAQIPGLMRIRVSSLEPGDISERLLDVFCAHQNIMPHIHLSVQSGSDNILKRMGRQYDSSELREKIALIKSRLDRPAITSDIIVGFPTETQEDFEQTAELAKWAGFSKMHIFGFSLREGTAATKMKGRIPSKIIKERAEILRKLSDELGRKFRSQFIGQTVTVLIEGSSNGQAFGHCERYFMVYINGITDYADYTDSLATKMHKKTQNKSMDNLVPSGLSGKNQVVRVKITAVTEEGAAAEAANSKSEIPNKFQTTKSRNSQKN